MWGSEKNVNKRVDERRNHFQYGLLKANKLENEHRVFAYLDESKK